MVDLGMALDYYTLSYRRKSCHICIYRHSSSPGPRNVVPHRLSWHGSRPLLPAETSRNRMDAGSRLESCHRRMHRWYPLVCRLVVACTYPWYIDQLLSV